MPPGIERRAASSLAGENPDFPGFHRHSYFSKPSFSERILLGHAATNQSGSWPRKGTRIHENQILFSGLFVAIPTNQFSVAAEPRQEIRGSIPIHSDRGLTLWPRTC
jgi:hypothetical protein